MVEDEGLYGVGGSDNFAASLIQSNPNIAAAASNSNIRDEEQANAITVYLAQLEMFEMEDEKRHLLVRLNLSLSIKMAARLQGLQAESKIVLPSISGGAIPSKKDDKDALEFNRMRMAANARASGDNGKDANA